MATKAQRQAAIKDAVRRVNADKTGFLSPANRIGPLRPRPACDEQTED
jgi:hypothetical protein